MWPCENGTSKSFSCARSFQAAQTKVTAFKWRASLVCQKKSWIAQKKFLRIWRNRMAQSKHQYRRVNLGKKEKPQQALIGRRWTCCRNSFCENTKSLPPV